MTDVETRLRTTFDADADAAPDADLPALARVVRGTVRRQRRRAASVGAAVAALVLAGAALVVPRLLTATTAPAVQVRPTPVMSSEVAGPALRWGGVVVPVPASYLARGAVECGEAVADAAYVDDPAAARTTCLAAVHHRERLTTVVLSPWDPTAPDWKTGIPERVLADGRTQLTTHVPGTAVMLRVTSPDLDLARRLLAGARPEPDLGGCTSQAVGAPPGVVTGTALLPGFEPVEGSVCSYTDGRLGYWRRLPAAGAADLLALIRRAVPADEQRTAPCAAARVDPERTGHWIVRLVDAEGRDVRLWVAAGPCPPSGVYGPDGGYLPLTRRLVDRITELAPGIAIVSDVQDETTP